MFCFQESHRVSKNDMRDVVSASDSRLIENNESNTHQENVSNLLNEAVLGLRGELGGK